MARIENKPKIFLTQKEREILRRTQVIFETLSCGDDNGDVFDELDNTDSNFCWMSTAIEKLINMSEVEDV